MTGTANSPGILIVGAGPTGLVLALWLTKLGLPCRIIDKSAAPGNYSRALAVQARTLEFYQQIGLAQAVTQQAHQVAGLNLWVRSAQAARVPLGDLGRGLTAFPFPLVFPQDEHERLLVERLGDLGVQVERQTELTGFEDDGRAIRATLRKPDGSEEICSIAYLAGCDGARSKVREQLNVQFPGGTYDHLFYVADVEAAGPPMNGELHVGLDDADFLAVFPLQGAGRARLIGSIRDDVAKDHEHLQFSDVVGRAMHNLKVQVRHVNWFSTYRVHHRVALTFRRGRAFLLGDAAHIHSPVGGQGMNTGIGDAVNLAWKLASVVKATAAESLLDSYEPERIAFARRLVATTDRAFTGVISPGSVARFVRTQVVPRLVPRLFTLAYVRRLAFRTVSQINVNYRNGPLSCGTVGNISGGDRLPWVKVDPQGIDDNYVRLTSLDWQIHVYGAASPDVKAASDVANIPLHEFPWLTPMGSAGLHRDAVYLIRPDGYVALAATGDGGAAILAYLRERQIRTVACSRLGR